MTDIEQQSLDAAMRDQEARANRSAFERAWAESLRLKAQAFANIPANALAYEMAWHAFRAGRASNGR